MNKLSGFTLIELIVSMAIIGILIGLGITSLRQLNAASEIQSTGRETVTLLNLLKNSAKNDVRQSSSPINFKGYKYEFGTNSDQFLSTCLDNSDNVAGLEWDCAFSAAAQSAILNNIDSPLNDPTLINTNSSVGGINMCESIYFESLTGDILIVPFGAGPGTQPTQGSCFIEFTDPSRLQKNYICVNGFEDRVHILFIESELGNACS
ncbi:MAG TPA: prepilin-type N-terminal cleavage/methylation domain-containing protein [Candidatus Dojkabacteria bacterium]|jgi:prepilin-type N-terminal cleavage/methylation domain-containing protein